MEQIKFEELIQQLATAEKAGNKERVLELTLQIINQKKKIMIIFTDNWLVYLMTVLSVVLPKEEERIGSK